MTNDKLREALLPCPFCGESNAVVLARTCDVNTPYDPAHRAFPIVRCACGASTWGANWAGPETAVAAWNTRDANARLIAAAPTLLAALELACDSCQMTMSTVNAVIAAIKQARGK